ncbi:hypothetical protein RND81_12G012800 [Saponaria officinalis]|uniref:Uncharacterized protein n=1 Tax=Saponaria officinalis TaxID=3572 RepID=A0AAW1H1Y5_SAPOF
MLLAIWSMMKFIENFAIAILILSIPFKLVYFRNRSTLLCCYFYNESIFTQSPSIIFTLLTSHELSLITLIYNVKAIYDKLSLSSEIPHVTHIYNVKINYDKARMQLHFASKNKPYHHSIVSQL